MEEVSKVGWKSSSLNRDPFRRSVVSLPLTEMNENVQDLVSPSGCGYLFQTESTRHRIDHLFIPFELPGNGSCGNTTNAFLRTALTLKWRSCKDNRQAINTVLRHMNPLSII